MPGSPTEYLDGTDLVDWADEAISSGTVSPFIAVLPAAGPDRDYNGEWAGPWERELVDELVPWIDTNLPTIADPQGRVIAGLSAGGFGAMDIGLRHPDLFGAVESWSGYFTPLRDGPFKHASKQVLADNDPVRLARHKAALLRADGTRFFVSTGPFHSHWFRPEQTIEFARELHSLRLPVSYHRYANAQGRVASAARHGPRVGVLPPLATCPERTRPVPGTGFYIPNYALWRLSRTDTARARHGTCPARTRGSSSDDRREAAVVDQAQAGRGAAWVDQDRGALEA